jgi:hypothetical protein
MKFINIFKILVFISCVNLLSDIFDPTDVVLFHGMNKKCFLITMDIIASIASIVLLIMERKRIQRKKQTM